MRLARIAILWAVAIGLGVMYYAEERPPPAPGGRSEPQLVRLVDSPEADVLAVRIVDRSIEIVLGRQQGQWALVEPADAGVPGDLVGAFIEALFAAVVLEDGRPVARDVGALGLDERRRIEIEVVDGTQRVFVVGGETPTGTSAYVRDPTGTVRIIGRNVLVYRQLLVDAVRASHEVEAPMGPVARSH